MNNLNKQALKDLSGSVEKLLLTISLPTQEYRLLQALADHPSLQNLGKHPMLVLFRKHFALMHCLYQIQDRWLDGGRLLSISPLQISLTEVNTALSPLDLSSQAVQTTDPKLKDFYLDWQQFELATEESVSEWMASFWTRMATGGEVAQQAYKALGLEDCADWDEVVKAYRKQASLLHPDRGGDPQAFMKIQAAYETLKSHLGKL